MKNVEIEKPYIFKRVKKITYEYDQTSFTASEFNDAKLPDLISLSELEELFDLSRVNRKIQKLENRKEYLGKKIDRLDHTTGSGAYIVQEYAALEWAIPVLEKVYSIIKANRESNVTP